MAQPDPQPAGSTTRTDDQPIDPAGDGLPPFDADAGRTLGELVTAIGGNADTSRLAIDDAVARGLVVTKPTVRHDAIGRRRTDPCYYTPSDAETSPDRVSEE